MGGCKSAHGMMIRLKMERSHGALIRPEIEGLINLGFCRQWYAQMKCEGLDISLQRFSAACRFIQQFKN